MYRVVYLLNARLTRWDLRSEYIYMYLAIYGAFAIHVAGLWRITGRRLAMPFLYALVLISVVYFSPAGHNNHWWSMMLQLNLANLFIAYALWRLARDPNGSASNVLAASAGWAATYTLTNGLVAMLVLAVIAHLPRPRLFAPGWRTVFWGVNLVAVFTLYLRGLPAQPGGRPGPFDLARFTFIYLGAPLGELLDYPYRGIFSVPMTTWFNGLIGVFLLAITTTLCFAARRRILTGDTAALVLLGFSLFAVGSALLTAWGRAEFGTGVAEANSSRYTIFGSFLLYGLVAYVAALAAAGDWYTLLPRRPTPPGRIGDAVAAGAATLVVACVIAFGAVAYDRGVAVYRNARQWNDQLARAYGFGPEARALDRIIYPDPERAEEAKATLMRLRIGPYRNMRELEVSSPASAGPKAFRAPVQLTPATPIYQEFTAKDDGLDALAVTVITWGQRPEGRISWRLMKVSGHRREHVVSGTLSIDSARDWAPLRIPIGYVDASQRVRYGLRLATEAPLPKPFGVPLFARGQTDRTIGPAVVAGKARAGLILHLTESYVQR